MKAFELRALLSRLPPDAEVFLTTARPGGHGSFASPVCGVSQDRTVREDNAERPVVVLHHKPSAQLWAAKGHAADAGREREVYAEARFNDGAPGMICISGATIGDEDRLNKMMELWREVKIDLRSSVRGDWTKLRFKNRAEALAFAEKLGNTVIVETVEA